MGRRKSSSSDDTPAGMTPMPGKDEMAPPSERPEPPVDLTIDPLPEDEPKAGDPPAGDPPAPVAEQPAAQDPKGRKPQPEEFRCTADAWTRINRVRPEHAAGFIIEMKRKHPKGARKTRPEWKQEWETFQNRPVR